MDYKKNQEGALFKKRSDSKESVKSYKSTLTTSTVKTERVLTFLLFKQTLIIVCRQSI